MSFTLDTAYDAEHDFEHVISIHITKDDVEHILGRTISDEDWNDYVDGIGSDHVYDHVNSVIDEIAYDFDEEYPEADQQP